MPKITRRSLLAVGAMAPVLASRAHAATGLRVMLLGQSLIQHDLRHQVWGDGARFSALFARADACFTDLETTIIGHHGGTVTRDPALLHRADASVLDCLSDMHINLFATANNHAFDVGTGGITDTMDALAARKLAYAGTGATSAAANAPVFLKTPHGRIALVAMATGKIRDGGAATSDRPGVNEVRQSAPGVLDEADVARFLASVTQAASTARAVIAYDHNHYWETDIAQVPPWQKVFAHRCIDAGAATFVGHGAPLLQAIEVYRGRPIFYGLGNFIYQSPSHDNPYGPPTWRSVIADCSFGTDKVLRVDLIPITLNSIGLGGETDLETRGRPGLARGQDALDILQDLAKSSAPFGTQMTIAGAQARLSII